MLPTGFLELAPGPASLGPFLDSYPAGTDDPNFPVLVRVRLYWGKPGEPAPVAAQGYPAAVLYGGPAPMAWALSTLPGWVRDWAATLQPPAGASADGSRWLVLLGVPALLVPPEALAFPYTDFRWIWLHEQTPADTYRIEGTRADHDFRNVRTGALEGPPAFGDGRTAIAGCTCPPQAASAQPPSGGPSSVELYSDSDAWDPRAITWLTEDEWRIHGGGVWPYWITNDYSVDLVGGVAGLHGRQESPRGLGEYYRRHRVGGPLGLIQCGATTHLGGVPTECSLVAKHPGPHMNGPTERIWWQCAAKLQDPRTGLEWRCNCPHDHPGDHRGGGHVWRNVSPRARGDTSIGALPSRTDQPTWNVLRYKSQKTRKVLYDQTYYRSLDEMFSKAVQERIKWGGRGSDVDWLTWDGKRWVDGWNAKSTVFAKQVKLALADKPAWAR